MESVKKFVYVDSKVLVQLPGVGSTLVTERCNVFSTMRYIQLDGCFLPNIFFCGLVVCGKLILLKIMG